MSPTSFPFLGMGISATAAGALTVAEARLAGTDPNVARLGFLNVGIGADTIVPAALPERLRASGLETVVHLEDINLTSALDEARLERVLERARPLAPHWLQEDLGVWLWGDVPLLGQMIGPIFDRTSLERASQTITRIMEVSALPFLAENPPLTFAVGDIDVLSFLSGVSDRTGCGLILDIGHLVGYCICTGRDPLAYVAGWSGLDRVIEIHIAGYDVLHTAQGTIWSDAHDKPLSELSLAILDAALARATNVRAISVEVEEATLDTLWSNVRRVEERVQPLAAE